MKAYLKKEGNNIFLQLPQNAASLYNDAQGAEIFYLKDGLYLLAISGLPSGALVQERANAAQNAKQSAASQFEPDEQALMLKLSRIRFDERTPDLVKGKINPSEAAILSRLISNKAISVFKSGKYPKGVYNIPKGFFYPTLAASKPAAPQKKYLPAAKGGKLLAINTFEHLQALGYMVLSNEGEARMQMEKIKSEIKDDDVKGVRGFDKQYYVLKKSFLREFENPVLALLGEGIHTSAGMSQKIGITSEAITVILMVMADEGMVIERRKGIWEKA